MVCRGTELSRKDRSRKGQQPKRGGGESKRQVRTSGGWAPWQLRCACEFSAQPAVTAFLHSRAFPAQSWPTKAQISALSTTTVQLGSPSASQFILTSWATTHTYYTHARLYHGAQLMPYAQRAFPSFLVAAALVPLLTSHRSSSLSLSLFDQPSV